MNVYIPYAGSVSAWTDAWAFWYCRQALYVDVSARNDSYARAFTEWWDAGPFIVVEQDVVPWPGAAEELDSCPEPWCAMSYYINDDLRKPYLGCAKFRPEGQVPFEGFPEDILTPYTTSSGLPHWQALDLVVAATLRNRGWEVHQHFPAVAHIKSPYQIASVGFLGEIDEISS